MERNLANLKPRMLPEPDRRLEDPELIRKQIGGIFEMLAGQPPTSELMQ